MDAWAEKGKIYKYAEHTINVTLCQQEDNFILKHQNTVYNLEILAKNFTSDVLNVIFKFEFSV